ncbi:MAG: antibiotic biosynthesis monooxygenase [Acidobacteria bacterium]|nr:antibiotic biosynthesis monooxygenase [Acidobacteriota bacterium]
MIIGTVRILPPLDRQGVVREVLQSVQGPVRAQPGCNACDIYYEQGPEPAIVFIERWDSDEALEAHLCSDMYRRILGAIELSGGRPEIRFEHVSASEGMELIERLRNPGAPTSAG